LVLSVTRFEIIKICRSCKRGALREVPGSKGRMFNCRACGWTGPKVPKDPGKSYEGVR
jgi:hypothetical protein